MRAQKTNRPEPEAGAATPSRDDGDDNDARGAAMHKRAQRHKQARNGGDAAAYNERHAAEVKAFNERTQNRCIGEDGKLDIAAVEAWQEEHGVEPDGKIGKQTLAAAGAPAEVARDAAAGQASGKRQHAPMDEFLDWFDVDEAYRVLAELGMMLQAPAAKADEDKNAADEKKPIEETGLASNLAVGEFAAAAQHIEKNWKKYTPHQRASKMMDATNEQLQAAGVLSVQHKLSNDLSESNAGRFSPSDWQINLSKTLFHQKKLKDDAGVEVATTIYHEARHAEQNYRTIQVLAGQGKTVEQIQKMTKINKNAVEDGAKKPFVENGPGAGLGQAIFDDKYGAGGDHHREAEKVAREKIQAWAKVRQRADDEKAKPEEREAAQKELQAMKAEVMAAYETYLALASESDAFGTQNKLKAAMVKK